MRNVNKDYARSTQDDLISRQAAIDALHTWFRDGFEEDKWWNSTHVLAALESVPFAQQEPQWIPCSERLPEANGRYLVTRGLNACGAMWNRIYLVNYSNLMGLKSERIWWNGNVGKSDFEHIDDVIAWMPLPEPWKGEQE